MTSFARSVRTVVIAGTMTAVGAVAAATSGMVFSTSVNAQTSSIVVQGNRRIESDTIRSYFSTAPGEPLTAARIDEAIKAMYATGLFRDVRVSRAGGRLIVNVDENEVINRIAFEGNRRLKTEQLQNEIESRPRGTFSRATVQSDVQRLYDIYRRTGRYDVEITPKTIAQPNGRLDLVFEINEGKKAGVRSINFVGVNAFGRQRLLDVMSTAESGIFSWLKSNDVYDADRLNADQEAIRRLYLRNGYVDMRVLSARADFDRAANAFTITIEIEEGPQYRVGSVDVESNIRDVDGATLRRVVRTQPGAVYNVELVDKSLEDITLDVARRGYAFATVRPRGERDPSTLTVNLVYVVEEGPRVYVERINVRGNTRTQDRVIRREFDIAEGDAYNRVLVDRAERRLKNLGYFKNVRITTEPGSAADRVIVNVDVEDQPTGQFSIAGGYSTSDGFIAEASVEERNFLGRGQFVRLGGTLGQRSKGVTFSFTEPFLMDYRLSGALTCSIGRSTGRATSRSSRPPMARRCALAFRSPRISLCSCATAPWRRRSRSAPTRPIAIRPMARSSTSSLTPTATFTISNRAIPGPPAWSTTDRYSRMPMAFPRPRRRPRHTPACRTASPRSRCAPSTASSASFRCSATRWSIRTSTGSTIRARASMPS